MSNVRRREARCIILGDFRTARKDRKEALYVVTAFERTGIVDYYD
jgi:hypothetical protein